MSNMGYVVGVNSDKALTYHNGTDRRRADGWLWKQCTGTAGASETSFSFDDDVPANSLVDDVAVIVLDGGTSTETVALGYTGTTGAFMTASSFTDTMDTAGAKDTTPIKVHLTEAKTPLATFSADLDTGAKVLVGVHFVHVPAEV